MYLHLERESLLRKFKGQSVLALYLGQEVLQVFAELADELIVNVFFALGQWV